MNANAIREQDPRRRLILALDVGNETEAIQLADRLRPELAYVKVGLELFAACGPNVVSKLVSLGLRVFLDLKLHDLPTPMAGAIRSLVPLGVRMTTVHATAASGVEAAATAAANDQVAVLAVTVLTSHGPGELEDWVGSNLSTEALVLRLGQKAIEAGATGLVASPREVAALRRNLGPEPLLVIPGIRPAWASADDQSRTASPAQALRDGADFLVVGRPITRASDPREALGRLLDEMAQAL